MYTMNDFLRDYFKKQFLKLTPQEQEEVMRGFSTEARLAGLSEEQIRQYLDKLTAVSKKPSRKPRRKK